MPRFKTRGSKTLYVEIGESHLIIGCLTRRRQFFICDPCCEWPLVSGEMGKGVIYNTAIICKQVRAFLKEHHRGKQSSHTYGVHPTARVSLDNCFGTSVTWR